MDFVKLLQRAKKEKATQAQTLGTLIVFNTPTIVEGIKRRWLFGKDPNGGIIGEYRSSDYRAFKLFANSRAGGYVDLTLSGDLGDGLTIRRKGALNYEIISTDWKFKHIAGKYGLEQFNLDAEQREELFDLLEYTLMEEFIDNVWLT